MQNTKTFLKQKQKMQKVIVLESSKFALFLLVIVLVIQFFHGRYERIANQFALDESESIHHSKNYAQLTTNQLMLDTCPLYPDSLSKFSCLSILISIVKFERHLTCRRCVRCEYLQATSTRRAQGHNI
jgi:hypothetical protein